MQSQNALEVENQEGQVFQRQMSYYRTVLLGAMIVYPAWSFFFQIADPNLVDPFLERALVAVPALVVFLASYRSPYVQKNISTLFTLVLYLVTLHYFFLLARNEVDPLYRAGTFITTTIILALMNGQRARLMYGVSTFILILAVSLYVEGWDFWHPTKNTSILFFGVLTISFFATISDRSYLAVEKAFEAERNKSAQLRHWSSIGRLAGGIAHEINTPLAVMTMVLSVLRQKASKYPQMTAELEKDIGRLEKMTERIASIIKSLREATPRQEANLTFCRLSGLLASAQELVFERFQSRCVDLKIEDQVGLGDYELNCAEGEFIHALLQVLGNIPDAVKGQNHPWARIEARKGAGNSIEIHLKNSGEKIPDEIAKHIFDPFFTTKEVGEGAGMGLGVARATVRSLGGDLHLDDSAEVTSFVFTLPATALRKITSRAA